MLCRYPPNPVRARLINFLQDNRWSSYHANAQGKQTSCSRLTRVILFGRVYFV